MAKILEVNNLAVSFRTTNGTVKAVRNVSFDLEKGKTLAIVGESGSGKSVTTKAILGILAGNSIVESGEILYDGKDLLKISEEDMCEIRGDKISMIFQDPLSALNPIVRIGKQITEAMLLKNKVSRKNARKAFNTEFGYLKEAMIAASEESGSNEAEIKEYSAKFDKLTVESTKLENSFNTSKAAAADALSLIEDFIFNVENKQNVEVKASIRPMLHQIRKITEPVLTAKYRKDIESCMAELKAAADGYKAEKNDKGINIVTDEVMKAVKGSEMLMNQISAVEAPDFFALAYYRLFGEASNLDYSDLKSLNELTVPYYRSNFADKFDNMIAAGLKHDYVVSLEKKKVLIGKLKDASEFYSKDQNKSDALKLAKSLSDEVEDSINRVNTQKDSMTYTFRSTLTHAIEKFYFYQANNPKEEARFARQTARLEAKKAAGKKADYKVVPKNVLDLDMLRADIVKTTVNLTAHNEEICIPVDQVDFAAKTKETIEYFRGKASEYVYKVTKAMAKEKAIKLMEEVGIPEPRTRYEQYPFEFSGGMRQRIVIAIALAANPDILICDEPTTALDVTIQAQILELINNLKKERNLTVIFITHDLGVVANMADEIAVLYAGKIVEYGTAEEIFYDPRHPYTWALLSSMPDLDTKEKLDAIPGTPPNMIYPPVGDAFAERNKYALEIDYEMQPPMFRVSDTHYAATWLLHPDAPKVEMPKIISDRIERMKKRAGGEKNV